MGALNDIRQRFILPFSKFPPKTERKKKETKTPIKRRLLTCRLFLQLKSLICRLFLPDFHTFYCIFEYNSCMQFHFMTCFLAADFFCILKLFFADFSTLNTHLLNTIFATCFVPVFLPRFPSEFLLFPRRRGCTLLSVDAFHIPPANPPILDLFSTTYLRSH